MKSKCNEIKQNVMKSMLWKQNLIEICNAYKYMYNDLYKIHKNFEVI